MAVPAAINKTSAVGMEVTPGTAVAVTKRFASFGLSRSRQYNIGSVRPQGSKLDTKHYMSGEYAEYSIEDGVLSYDEALYALAGIFRKTTAQSAPTSVATTLASGTTNVATSITVAAGGGAVLTAAGAAPFKVKIDDEVLNVTAVSTDTLTVTRAQEGTVGAAHLTAAPVTRLAAATAKRWIFDMNAFSRDDVQTYTVESGDTANNRGGKAPQGEFTEWSFEVSRDGDTAEMGGSMMSQAIVSGALTAGLTLGDFTPITPQQCEVYMDTTRANLAPAVRSAARITNAFNFGFSIGDRKSPVWFFNRAKAGYSASVEAAPDFEISLQVADEADPVDDILTSLGIGQRIYVLFEAIGANIITGIPYRFEAEFACQVSDAPDEGEEQDAQAVSFTLAPELDSTWGKGFEFRLDNAIATL